MVIVDLSRLVAGVCSTFENDARFAMVEFEANLAEGSTVLGVSQRLESVVRNLLENALFAADARGRIVIDVASDDNHVTLAVTDCGPGIPEDELPRLFERFYSKRGDGTRTGLGLALARAIVEARGGTLSAANHATGGARFEARLPSSS